MDDYLQLPLLDRNSNELDWWNSTQGNFHIYKCWQRKNRHTYYGH